MGAACGTCLIGKMLPELYHSAHLLNQDVWSFFKGGGVCAWVTHLE